MSFNSKNKRSYQKKMVLYIAVVIGGLIISAFVLIKISSGEKEEERVAKYIINLPSDKEDIKKLWEEKLEDKNQELSEKLLSMEKTIESNRKEQEVQMKRFIEELKADQQLQEKSKDEKNHLAEEISRLKTELTETTKVEKNNPVMSENTNLPFEESIQEEVFLPLTEWQSEEIGDKPKTYHVDNVIPSGTTIKALLVSSLDAPCGVNAHADPQPIKLRVLDNAHLPKGVRAKLKGSLIIGSAYGNISSERVLMRAERITKLFKGGLFIETEMSGYVTGEDGRYGVRGTVVDKSYQMVARATFSGFLSGISEYLQSTVNTQNIARATKGLPNDIRWDVLQNSGLQGVNSALDKLAEYNIKRAEQLVPVIQISAGRIVDVTFTHNVRLGEVDVKSKLKKIRERSRAEGNVVTDRSCSTGD